MVLFMAKIFVENVLSLFSRRYAAKLAGSVSVPTNTHVYSFVNKNT
jgi:hypothetical protein